MAPAPVIGNGSQVGTRPRGSKRLVHTGGAESTGRMEIGVDDVTVVRQHLARGFSHGVPGLCGFHRDAEVDLIARVGVRVEPKRLPAAPVLDRESAGDDGLGEDGRQLVGPARPDFRRHDARDVALDIHAIHHGETAAPRRDADAPAIAPAVRHHEPVLGDVHDRDAAQRLSACAVGLHQPEPRGISRIGEDDPPRPGRNRSHRRAARGLADEQLAALGPADRRIGESHRETDAQLRLARRGRRSPGWPRAGGRRDQREASERALRPAPHRAARW